MTGVYRAFEQSIELRFLIIFAFGLGSLETQHSTSSDKLQAAFSCSHEQQTTLQYCL